MTLTGKLVLAAVAFAALSGSAMAADLYVPPAAAPAAAAPATNWDGPYVGATIGYDWYQPTVVGNGFTAGGQIGYNFHIADPIVLGIQGNIDYANFQNSPLNSGVEGAITGRVGYDADSFLPYVEAGVAFLNATPVGGNNTTATGWTVGGGVEFMLADNISANVEYRYTDYGSAFGPDITSNAIRVGPYYHF